MTSNNFIQVRVTVHLGLTSCIKPIPFEIKSNIYVNSYSCHNCVADFHVACEWIYQMACAAQQNQHCGLPQRFKNTGPRVFMYQLLVFHRFPPPPSL